MRRAARATAGWLTLLIGCAALAASAAEPPSPAAGTAARPRVVVAFANEPHPTPSPAGASSSRYSGEGYLVGQNAQREASEIAKQYALHALASWPIKSLSMYCVVYEITDGRAVEEVIAALAKDKRVQLAQPLQEFHTLTDPAPAGMSYNDPLYDLQSNLLALGIARAHQRTQGAGIRIALIDTGVDVAHPDLAGRIVHSHSYLATRAATAGSLRHGTAMAGIIAAVANNHTGIVGIAPRAQLEVFEACWQLSPASDAAACDTFTLAQALAAAIGSGAPLVNLSIAGPADPLLSALVRRGLERGVTFVAAVAGPDATFPTAIPGVLAAGGSEHDSQAHELPAGAFAAPAAHVLTLRPDAQYDFVSGSSVAAAELTGVIALLMSAAPGRVPTRTLVELLREPAASAVAAAPARDPSAVDINGALARLDAQGARRLAARETH